MKYAFLRRFPVLGLGLLLAASISAPAALAQTPRYGWRSPNPDVTRAELSHFDNFLDSHPAMERDLRQNPRLIDNPNYVRSHPELREFLGSHPGVREEARETPNYFVRREARFDQREDRA